MFDLITGIVKVCLFLIGSQNTSLTELRLGYNQIGDAGAASMGDALAYVTIYLVNELSCTKTFLLAPPNFFGLIMALSRLVCV